MQLKNTIALVTVLLFIYNALFSYIIINLTYGTDRLVFLGLLCFDYVIIFYFVAQLAHEVKFVKPGAKKKGK